jgi:hypothetical protein
MLEDGRVPDKKSVPSIVPPLKMLLAKFLVFIPIFIPN